MHTVVGYCKVKRSCFRTFGGKVLGIFVLMIRQFHRNKSSWNVHSRGMKVPRELMFHGTKVLGTFAPEERKFHRSESSKERMFHGTKVPRERKFSLWTFRCLERKCWGTKRPGITLRTDRRTDLLYQYRASVCWRAIKTTNIYQQVQSLMIVLDVEEFTKTGRR